MNNRKIMHHLQCISPIDNSVYIERALAGEVEIRVVLDRATKAQQAWRRTPIHERIAIVERAVKIFSEKKERLARELCWMMGRPIRFAEGEILGFVERAQTMAELSLDALAEIRLPPKKGFIRFIRREPLGVSLVIAPWNYPYLTAVNAVVPSLLCGNTVILKHSAQTPLCAERMVEIFREAGLPYGVFQYLHLNHAYTRRLACAEEIQHVAFTGSVAAGANLERTVAGRFIPLGLELGGKDPAYVRTDADLPQAVAAVVDGAYFNSGQSCCSIERAYVHKDIFDEFISQAVALIRDYQLGRPDKRKTTLGPLVRAEAADRVRAQIDEAVAEGARAHIASSDFAMDKRGTQYMAPQLLTGVRHHMRIMREESFGPVLGVQKVHDDGEALEFMNNSPFGLTAAIFSKDEKAAMEIGSYLETGTVFMNRCDYLDPELAWAGAKQSGRGCTLSEIGFEQLTRPKSFHFKVGE
ncbi:aldehyde dehydrogenase family protein [Microbulbifer sp. OS29]|uniref:Aldehyde dehydrogenase family protein n=1 Tax=Microbulbifer okhotskensis TaxID=2926617 RepID=A0A9X2EN47_9GAMM|nr:aldehyde dehydrogenase family protein [Microbulbifer okhotskensis]MCO1334645.1 aldehyde dehydrogenase family protein [Microbulbifer okhotskensis]